jgi:hypothetical protein
VKFEYLSGVAVDGDGNILVTDGGNHCRSARSHHRAKCPHWLALVKKATQTEMGGLLLSSIVLVESQWTRAATSL